jgi:hypothetical protein
VLVAQPRLSSIKGNPVLEGSIILMKTCLILIVVAALMLKGHSHLSVESI